MNRCDLAVVGGGIVGLAHAVEGLRQSRSVTLFERRIGVYSKMINGASEFICEPIPGVRCVIDLGGAGMTLSFGLAQEVLGGVNVGSGIGV